MASFIGQLGVSLLRARVLHNLDTGGGGVDYAALGAGSSIYDRVFPSPAAPAPAPVVAPSAPAPTPSYQNIWNLVYGGNVPQVSAPSVNLSPQMPISGAVSPWLPGITGSTGLATPNDFSSLFRGGYSPVLPKAYAGVDSIYSSGAGSVETKPSVTESIANVGQSFAPTNDIARANIPALGPSSRTAPTVDLPGQTEAVELAPMAAPEERYTPVKDPDKAAKPFEFSVDSLDIPKSRTVSKLTEALEGISDKDTVQAVTTRTQLIAAEDSWEAGRGSYVNEVEGWYRGAGKTPAPEGDKLTVDEIKRDVYSQYSGLKGTPSAAADFQGSLSSVYSALESGNGAEVAAALARLREARTGLEISVAGDLATRYPLLNHTGSTLNPVFDSAGLDSSRLKQGAMQADAAMAAISAAGFSDSNSYKFFAAQKAELDSLAGAAETMRPEIRKLSDPLAWVSARVDETGAAAYALPEAWQENAGVISEAVRRDPMVAGGKADLLAVLKNNNSTEESREAARQVFADLVRSRVPEIAKTTPIGSSAWGQRFADNHFERDWTAIMGAGALALALFSPIENQMNQRRADKRADKQWEKERAWDEARLRLVDELRDSGGGGSSSKGTPSGVNVAQFA